MNWLRTRTGRLVTNLLRRYWRLKRGLTLGAQGVVLDGADRVLLVRHGYRPGWHLPGGGVERRETVREALARELQEEAGIVIDGAVELHGLFANEDRFAGDHIAVFVVRRWQQSHVPQPSFEIAEHKFYALDALPSDLEQGTRRRLTEIFQGAEKTESW